MDPYLRKKYKYIYMKYLYMKLYLWPSAVSRDLWWSSCAFIFELEGHKSISQDIPAERERGWEKLCSSEVRAWRFAVSRICQFVLDKHLGGSSLSLPNTRDSWHGWNLQVWWFLALGLFRLPFWTDAARLPTRKRRNSRKEEKKSLWHVQGEMKV